MRLEMEKGEILSDPDSRALETALRSLDGESNSFAVLDSGSDPGTYLQAIGGPDLFTVEYREAGQHFRRDEVRLEMVIALFQSYRRGTDWWRSALAWKDVTREFQ
ncbi:MAG TPA: hypothetical protein VNN18_04025 [Candidatus Xenobia bacterium]|nr:hypothetical protein [Candidatus Xenobia bacterium]